MRDVSALEGALPIALPIPEVLEQLDRDVPELQLAVGSHKLRVSNSTR